MPELLELGICGWLVPAGSLEPLTTAMRSALNSPVEKLESMGNIGVKLFASQHNDITEASKSAALFQDYYI